jgi:hypothetical protein
MKEKEKEGEKREREKRERRKRGRKEIGEKSLSLSLVLIGKIPSGLRNENKRAQR